MPYSPPAHTAYPWHDAPATDTPLDAAHLEAAEDDLVGYTQQVANGLSAYADAAMPTRTGIVYATDYGVKADGRTVTDASISATTNPTQLSSAAAQFTFADVNKRVVVIGAGAAGAHLYTTISSVAGGVATLAASAATTVTAAEVWFGTDNTANLQSAVNAAAGKALLLPVGDIGVIAPIVTAQPIQIVGQGVNELYGGTSATNDANFPTIAPYLEGTVVVQAGAGVDALQLTAQGRSQSARDFGIRFAGRYNNTGHGLNSAPSGALGNIGGRIHNVPVFGTDGSHYCFIFDSPELINLLGLRGYGGGGFWLKTNSTSPGPPGNLTSNDCYFVTYINGTAHAVLIDSSPGAFFDSCLFNNLEGAVRIPNPAIAGTTPPAGTTQKPLQTLIHGTQDSTIMGFVGCGFESDTGSGVIYPTGVACWRTNDPNGPPVQNPAMATNLASGQSTQNRTGKNQLYSNQFLLQPPAAASAQTTLGAASAAGATSITVASAAGISVGSTLQIDTLTNMEFTVVTSVNGTTIGVMANGGWGLALAHASGVNVSVGPAVVVAQINQTNSFPSPYRMVMQARAINTGNELVSSPAVLVPTGWWLRLDYGSAQRAWSQYVGTM